MPFYDYVCIHCEHICEKFHGMKEDRSGEKCSVCSEINAMQKLPSQINISHNSDVGKIVAEFIRENKEIAQKEKERLSKQEYKK